MSGIDGIGAPRPINKASDSESINIEKLFPKILGKAASVSQFEAGIARFEANYPVHGQSAKIARDLQEGLDLSYEPMLPLTQASRAIGSALAHFKDEDVS